MRPSCLLIRRFGPSIQRYVQRRNLLTLAIETSCDDTSVAILEKYKNNSATLHFHSKITSDNRKYGGVYPIVAHESHQQHLANLVAEALQSLPILRPDVTPLRNAFFVSTEHGGEFRKKPDFVTVTRGPGMRANLITGVDTAKGLAVAWQVPLLGVNHMQAHALTPRLVSALDAETERDRGVLGVDPPFPYLSLLVSGGHTMLVHSRDLCDHEILANTTDIAVGDMIDKCARDILPLDVLASSEGVSYGPALEQFAFPIGIPPLEHLISAKKEHPEADSPPNSSWSIRPPLQNPGPGGLKQFEGMFSFSGTGSSVKRITQQNPTMQDDERSLLAREAMRVAFEHLASRVLIALKRPDVQGVKALVVSGGVASNQFLKQVLRRKLNMSGYNVMRLVFPPPKFCTDNAAMIAWTGMEMWEAGYRTELDAMALRKWAIDPRVEGGGILGANGWKRETSE